MKTTTLTFSRRIIRSSLLLLLAFLLFECRGPRGFDGEDGLDGLDGDVYAYSAVYDVAANSWSGDAEGYNTFLDVPEITSDIFYTGAVLVYRLFEATPMSFNMLPYTWVDNTLTIYMDYNAYIGEIELMYKEVYDGVNDTFAPADPMAFKIVIIEGIPLATVKNMVDVKDYNAVVKTFKIQNVNGKYNKVY